MLSKKANSCQLSPTKNTNRPWLHYGMLTVVLLGLLVCHLWTSHRQQYSAQFTPDFGEDFINIVTLGRQMVECHDLPTFMFPGKIYDGPVKPFALYFPCLLVGYLPLIPVVMAAIYRVLIALCCYFIARKMVSPLAGLIALVLCGAMDQWLVIFVFQYSFFYDIWILQSLIIALMTISWAKRDEKNLRQPGLVYCLTMGLIAGMLWYTHPLGSTTIIAAAIFLLISHGKQIFTWRIPAVATAFFAGSLPFWIYWMKHPGIIEALRQFSSDNPRAMSLNDFFLSTDGYLWFLMSPSASVPLRIFVTVSFIACFFTFLKMLFYGIKDLRKRKLIDIWNNGIPLSSIWYCPIFCIALSFLIWATLGMAQFVGINFIYGMELWFWIMMLASFSIHFAIKRSALLIAIAAALIPIYIWLVAIHDFPTPNTGAVKKYNHIAEDAQILLENGYTNILSDKYEDYMYMVTGPGGLNVAERFMPWSLPMAREVEQSIAPVILGELHKPTLGNKSWSTTLLQETKVNHSFQMPHSGKILPADAWDISVSNASSNSLPNIKDRDLWTSWTAPVSTNDIFLHITLDKPRQICRLMLWSHRDDVAWDRSTYFNLSSRGIREHIDLSSHTMPLDQEIQGLQSNGTWVTIAEGVSERGYFWDGGRIFYDRFERHRTDIRFSTTVTSEIRIIDRGSKWRPRRITELYIFETSETATSLASKSQEVSTILDILKDNNIERVYADRFISAQINKYNPNINVWKPSFLRTPSYRLSYTIPWPWYVALEAMQEGNSAIVADSAFAPEIKHLLDKAKVPATIHELMSWTVFLFNDETSTLARSGLVWCGWSLIYYPDKVARRKDGDVNFNLPADMDISFENPPLFNNGAELIGLDFDISIAKPGDNIKVTYYWRIPGKWKYYSERPIVFAHYINGQTVINDDHKLLGLIKDNYLRDVLPSEVFSEERILWVPPDSPSGTYELEIGMLYRDNRVDVKAKDKTVSNIKRKALYMNAFGVE